MSLWKAAAYGLVSCSLLVAGCGGGDDDGGTPPQTQSFSLSVTPTALSIQAGAAPTSLSPDVGSSASIAAAGTGTLDVTITRAGGFTGSVAVGVEGLPTGVTASPLTIGATSTLGTITITASATASVGTSTLTLRATGTGVTEKTATVQLTITAAASFSLALAPAALSIVQGQSGGSTVNITRAGGFAGAVNLTHSGQPAGITVAITPTSVTGGSAAIAVSVAANVAPAAYPITIQGTGTGVANKTATLTVTVTTPPSSSIALSVPQAPLSVQQGQSGTTTLTITRTNFTDAVALTSSGAPAGMTVSFNPTSATGTTSTITVDVGAAVPTGSHAVTIQGSGTGIANATTTLNVTVTPPPSSGIALALNPAALSIAAGASATSGLTITRTNFGGPVALTSTGAPAGMTVTPNPASVTGTTSTITVDVGAAVPTGTYSIVIQGAGTGITSATTTLTVTVTAAAGSIALTVNPATLSVQQGSSGNTTLTIARTNFTGTVNLTNPGPTAGVSVSFNPASTTGTSSTVTVAVGAAVVPGTYQITLQGAGTGITNASVTLSLTVTASGGSGNVTFTFCQQTGTPLWFAFSSNGGAWTQVSGTNNVYSFTINTRGIVAYVLPAGPSTQLYVIYGTQTELAGRGSSQCLGTGAVKTINATVLGVAAGELARVSMGAGGGVFIGGITANPIQLTNVQDGLRDLIGVRSTGTTTLTANSIVIQRDLNIANNGSVTVDFATGVAPINRTSTIANLGTQEAFFSSSFISKNFSTAGIYFDAQPGTSLTRNWQGVPDASTVSGDFHVQTVTASNAGSTTGFPSRSVTYYSRLAANQTLTLPDPIATLPTVAAAATSPYVTINSNWVIQSSQYNAFWTLTLTPAAGSGPSAVVSGSSAYFGNGPVTLNIPAFGAGFNAAHGLQAGALLNWTFFAAGGAVYATGPGEGAIGTFATVGGSFTP